ncbi:hypothetical protein BG005_001830 [Podila minutissima]|nr:hypothetical protein BG005_001830 [Podila minutissima]
MLLANMNLLYSNPQLSVLVLDLLGIGDDDKIDCMQQGLESLTRLKTLHLKYLPSYLAHRLVTVLDNNATSLTSLIIRPSLYIPVFDGCQPLESLTDVDLYIGSDCDQQLPQLFRNCPSLTRLKLIHHEVYPVTELSKTMREFCPNLESIHYRNAPNYNDPLPEGNAETILQASGRWLYVDTNVSCVSAEFLALDMTAPRPSTERSPPMDMVQHLECIAAFPKEPILSFQTASRFVTLTL